MYKKELEEYLRHRKNNINNILANSHKMYKEDIIENYKNAPYEEIPAISNEEDIAQDKDYIKYLKFLMRLK